MELDGAAIIVTGAGSGVGRELARTFARHGAQVLCVGRRSELVRETAEDILAAGGVAHAATADVTQQGQVTAMVEQALDAFGRVDVLFNNAGSFRSVAPVWEVDPETWWSDVTTNLLGTLLCCRAVLPFMRARDEGVIINMDGGGGAYGPNLGGSGYGASKAAIVRFTEGLARECETDGSRVLAVCMNPGFVRTDMTEALVADPTGERWQPFVRRHIDEGLGHAAADCAEATVRLLGILGPELNGCCFTVDTDFDEVDRERARIGADRLFTLRLSDRP